MDNREHAVSYSVPVNHDGFRETAVGGAELGNAIYDLVTNILVDDLLVDLVLLLDPAVILGEVFVHGGC